MTIVPFPTGMPSPETITVEEAPTAALTTREQWLQAGIDRLRPELHRVGATVPGDLYVSTGFPSSRATSTKRRALGECWPKKASVDDRNHVLITPLIDDPVEVLAVLTHELVHAADNGASGHRGFFAAMVKALGLGGKPSATTPGEMAPLLADISAELGPYPHAAINPTSDRERQSTRLLKIECPSCGYLARASAKWVDIGLPTCVCGTGMVRGV